MKLASTMWLDAFLAAKDTGDCSSTCYRVAILTGEVRKERVEKLNLDIKLRVKLSGKR